MAVGDAHVFRGFLTPVFTHFFFPKPPTTFLTCLCTGERRIYVRKKSCLNRGSNSQPPGHESDTPLSHPGGASVQIESFCKQQNVFKEKMEICLRNGEKHWEKKEVLATEFQI